MMFFYRIAGVLLLVFTMLQAQEESFKKYADELGLNIGTALGYQFERNTPEHNEIVIREFNTVVAENTMKAVILHKVKGQPDFSRADKLIDFAQHHGMRVRGHTLVWHFQNADWICTGERESTLENMKFHIETVMEHFKGKVHEWDVVNEALEEAPTGKMRDSEWLRSIGPDYVDSAFAFAHRVDPDCKLFYNDFGTSVLGAKSDSMYAMVKRLLNNGIPIHGVGFQAHQTAADAVPELYLGVRWNFERFAELGLDLAITEMDVTGSDWEKQAEVYETFMRVTLELPAVKSFVVWGVRDNDSWRRSGTPLLFDDNWEPKPAYVALMNLLKDPPAAVQPFPGSRSVKSGHDSGQLLFNGKNRTLSLRNTGMVNPLPIAIYDLRGTLVASAVMSAGIPLTLASLLENEFTGTLLVCSEGGVLRVNVVR